MRTTDRAEERAGLLELLASDPREHGHPQSRWTLAALRDTLLLFTSYSLSGLWRVLAGHKLHWKRARDHLRSPDPAYQAKLARVRTLRAMVDAVPDAAVLVYLDELTYYRQPSLAAGYAAAHSDAPRAERSHRRNTPTRVIAALEARTGRVVAYQGARLGVRELVAFYQQLAAAYPGRRLYVVQDNWPVHFHPDVLAALEPQTSPFPFLRPPSWPTEPSPTAKHLDLPIQLVQLPTYAPWANPAEKLWRWLKQDVLHLHRLADDLPALRALVLSFLHAFAQGSHDLLRYVGLPLPT
ncbi:MAG: IS630 family transposase [Chloroflexota bacterium]